MKAETYEAAKRRNDSSVIDILMRLPFEVPGPSTSVDGTVLDPVPTATK